MSEEIGYAEAPVREQGAVQGELQALSAQIDRLEHQVDRLHKQLAPVLRGEQNVAKKSEMLSDVSGSEVTRNVRTMQERVVRVVDIVTETLDRVEV